MIGCFGKIYLCPTDSGTPVKESNISNKPNCYCQVPRMGIFPGEPCLENLVKFVTIHLLTNKMEVKAVVPNIISQILHCNVLRIP